MATTPKKSTTASKTTAAKKSTTSTAKKATTSRAKSTTTQSGGMPRYGWGAIWGTLGLVELFSLFGGSDGTLHFVSDLFKSCIGVGWYVLPACTLVLAVLLFVRSKGPVRLQGTALMLFPLLLGSLVHGIFSDDIYSEGIDVFSELMTGGREGTGGGLLAGGIFEMMDGATAALLVIFVLLLLIAVDIMLILRLTPRTLWEAVRPPEAYDYDDDDEREFYEKPRELPNVHQVAAQKRTQQEQVRLMKKQQEAAAVAAAQEAAAQAAAAAQARPQLAFDIPLEGEAPRPAPVIPTTPTPAMPQRKGASEFLRNHLPKGMRGIDPSIVAGNETGADAVPSGLTPTKEEAAKMQHPVAVNPFDVTEEPQPDPFADILQLINKPHTAAPMEAQAAAPVTPQKSVHVPLDDDFDADYDNALDSDLDEFNNYDPADGLDRAGNALDHNAVQTASATLESHPQPNTPATNLDDDVPWDVPITIAKPATVLSPEEALAAEIAANQQAPISSYIFPTFDLLNRPRPTSQEGMEAELTEYSHRLVDTLQSFNVIAEIIGIVRGPSVTRFEVTINRGIKFSRITSLADDIALSLGATSVRIAPIPDKSAIGIEVPNKVVTMVTIREVIESKEFRNAKSLVSFSVGKDITGEPIIGDIGKMPHLLIAGTTGSGKSVCINSLLISLLYKSTPAEVRLIMVDPKMVELGNYNGVPHLLIPVVTDPEKAAGALNWAVGEMERRYKCFADNQVRNLVGYNDLMERRRNEAMETEGGTPEVYQALPEIVIVIDELADLMMVAAKDVETSICRIAQKARAAGMYLIVATQRPSADVITGLMKANIPSRIAFAVASQMESRIILDQTGAEKLIGKGDMLYSPIGAGKAMRVQGCFISSDEIEEVIAKVKEGATAEYSEEILEHIERRAQNGSGGGATGDPGEDEDEMLWEAVDVVMEARQASTSMLQRRLKLGYARAARIVDQMEERGIVAASEGAKPRQILVTREQWQEMKARRRL